MSTRSVEVSTPGVERWRPVADVLAAAFVDDPLMAWLLPDPVSRPARLRRFFALEARHTALPHGSCVAAADGVRDPVGAALVLPPGRTGTSPWFQVRHGPTYTRVFGRHVARAAAYSAEMQRVHPREPHVYLFSIGVHPDAQGRGVTTTMLAPTLRRCDEQGLPAYLEASSPASARLYRRLGFETGDVLRFRDAPPAELMTRAPR